jgi:hypothetical protein
LARIHVDWENNAQEWWEAARDSSSAPDAIRPLLALNGPDSIEVPDAVAADIQRWARTLPGWNIGTSFAKYPIRFVD